MSSTALALPQPVALALPASVPAPIRAAAEALQAGPPVSLLSTPELGDHLVVALPAMALLLGHSKTLVKSADIEAMADAVAEMIHRRFARLNLVEIGLALRRGASGEWPRSEGDVLLVSLPHVTHWLSCYCKEARAEAQLAVQAAAPKAVLPAPRIDYVGLVANYVALARAGELPLGFELDMGNLLYTWLKEVGAFTGFRTGEQYAQMRQEETDRLLAVTLPESGADRREYTSFVNALGASGELPESHPLSRSVVNACKKRVLREWLEYAAWLELDEQSIAEFLANPQAKCLCYRVEAGEVCPDCHDSGRKQLPDLPQAA
jgi:hypothetical protein